MAHCSTHEDFMFATLFIALIIGQVEPASSAPDAELSAELTAQVKRLVRRLDDRELTERNDAEASLIELGPKILDFLPQVTARTPAETKQRLERIRKALEDEAVEAATQAAVVSLSGEMSLSDAMKALEKQTGNMAVGFENRTATVKVDFDETPYWKALDTILDQAGLTVDPYGGRGDAINVRARPAEELSRVGSAGYNGVFRFEPMRIDAVRDLRNPSINGLRLALKVEWEPRLQPITMSQPLATTTVLADDGSELSLDIQQRTLSAVVQSRIPAVELVIPLELPTRNIEKIASLKGEIETLIPGRNEKFQFDKLIDAKDVEQKRAGVNVTVERVRPNGELFGIRIRVRFDKAANALESHRGWIFSNPAYILDADGEQVDNVSYETTLQGENEIGLEYFFLLEDGLKDCKFVYETPAAIVKKTIKYEVKDILLP